MATSSDSSNLASASPAGSTGRLLVVDDEFELMTALVEMLLRAGYVAEGRASAKDALLALREREFDVLLTDLMMPGMTGLELLRLALELDPLIVGIIMTGHATVQTAVDAMKSGAFDYVLKPFKLQTVLPVLTRAMELRQLRLENVQLRETAAIQELSQAIAHTHDLNVILNKTVAAALQQLQAEEGSILLPTPERDALYVAVAHGEQRDALLGQRVPFDMSIAGWVAGQRESLILDGEIRDVRFAALHPRSDIQTAMSVPMVAAGKLVGVLNVNALRRARPFTLGQVKALSVLANTAAAALESESLYNALRVSEKRFRALIENSADAITLLGADGTIVYDSPAAPGMLGYGRDELIGQTVFELIHPVDRPRAIELFRQLLEKPDTRIHHYFRIRHKTGAWRWIEAVASNLFAEPSVKAIVINYHDVTERKLAEAALNESRARFQNAMEHSASGMALAALDGHWLQVNRALCEIVGYSEDELLATSFQAITHPDDLDADLNLMRQLLAGEIHAYHLEKRYFHKRGHVVWIILSASLVRDERGEPLYFIAQIQDITERKQAEAELAALYRATSPLLGPGNDLTSLAEEIAQTVTREFALTDCGVLLVNDSQSELKRVARAGNYDVTTASTLALSGSGLTVAAFNTGEIVYAPEVTAHPRYLPGDSRTRSELAIPLQVGSQVIGLLDLQSPVPDAFDERARRIVAAYAERAALALQNTRLHIQTEQRLHRLSALRAIDQAISGSLDLRITLNILLEQVITNLQVDATDVLLLNPYMHTLDYTTGRGFRSRVAERLRARSGEGYAGRAILERRVISLPNLADEEPDLSRAAMLGEEGFQAYFGVPLIAKANVKGVLEIFHRTPLNPNPEWLDFLDALAGQAAIAIDNAELFAQLQHSNVQLIMAYDATIEGWSRALDLRDKETEGHSQRVTEMTLRLGQAMDIGEDELVHVRRGALLHDIGKMGVPDHILLKPGKLTEEEWDIMRKHPAYAHELLSPIVYLRLALDIPYCHHEKWDGTGYPRGLKGEQIPLAARLFAVVDVWDALRSDRPYRQRWSEEKVLEYIRSQTGTHFDPAVVELFLRVAGNQERQTGVVS